MSKTINRGSHPTGDVQFMRDSTSGVCARLGRAMLDLATEYKVLKRMPPTWKILGKQVFYSCQGGEVAMNSAAVTLVAAGSKLETLALALKLLQVERDAFVLQRGVKDER